MEEKHWTFRYLTGREAQKRKNWKVQAVTLKNSTLKETNSRKKHALGTKVKVTGTGGEVSKTAGGDRTRRAVYRRFGKKRRETGSVLKC